MARIIHEGAFLYTEGLYILETELVLAGTPITKWELFSAEGYCFYDLTLAENYDEEGNLLPPEQRTYVQYMIMRKDEAYVEQNIISVPIEEGYEIIGRPNDHETA